MQLFVCTILFLLPLVISGFLPTKMSGMRLRSSSRKMLEEDEVLEGAIGPMKVAIDKGFKIGKSITWGVLQREVDPKKVPNDAGQTARRATAASELVNIDDKERSRRKTAGSVGAVVSTVLYGVLVSAKVSALSLGLAMYLPVAFSMGFIESGRQGL